MRHALLLSLVLIGTAGSVSATPNRSCYDTPRCEVKAFWTGSQYIYLERLTVCLRGKEVELPFRHYAPGSPNGFKISCEEVEEEKQVIECRYHQGMITVAGVDTMGYDCFPNVCQAGNAGKGEIRCVNPEGDGGR